MSIGNLKTDGGKGTNWPWQYKMLLGLDKIAQTLKDGTEFESELVTIDCSGNPSPPPSGSDIIRLEVRVWDTDAGEFTSVQLYEVGSATPDLTDYSGCTKTYLSGDATEATLQAILAMNTDIEAKTTLVVANTDTIKADTQDILTKATAIEISNAAIEANTDTVVVTPALSDVTAAGTIAAGSRSVSISNVGTETGTILGADVPAGATVTFDAGGLTNTLGAVAYDPTTPGTGTRFLIATTT